nr:EthD family reductase [uncultured Arsenicibacter sp.]
MLRLIVLYPQPADVQQFEADYVAHLALLHEKAGIPVSEAPYTITKMLPASAEAPAFYQMFELPFPSAEALQAAMASQGMQEVGADAQRISTGGLPVILIGAG